MTHTIDCRTCPDAHALHQAIALALGFLPGYGCNLDALHDCLTDLREDTTLTFIGLNRLSFSRGFCRVLQDSAAENPHLTLRLV